MIAADVLDDLQTTFKLNVLIITPVNKNASSQMFNCFLNTPLCAAPHSLVYVYRFNLRDVPKFWKYKTRISSPYMAL